MAASIGGKVMNVGYVGDKNGELAKSIGGQLDLVSYQEAGSSLEAVVIEGATVEREITGEAHLRKLLDGTNLLALASPTQEILDLLGQITGRNITGQTDLVFYVKDTVGNYQVLQLWQKLEQLHSLDEHGNAGPAQAVGETALGSMLASVLPGLAAPASKTADGALDQAQTSLWPPQGATFGVSSFSFPNKWTNITCNDDRTAGNNEEEVQSMGTAYFYVYYVDGEGGTPYYYVIVQLVGSMATVDMLANTADSKGYFQYQLPINTQVNDSNDKPFSSGVSLRGYSPLGNQVGQAVVDLSQQMTLEVTVSGGPNPQVFTAQIQDTINLPGWAVLDKTQSSGPGWLFYQHDSWNPITSPPSDFFPWSGQVYDGSDHVIPMPNLSFGTIAYDVAALWRFDGSLFAPNSRSLVVRFSGDWTPSIALLHNPNGCNSNPPHHHLFTGAITWGFVWTIDLGSVARQT